MKKILGLTVISLFWFSVLFAETKTELRKNYTFNNLSYDFTTCQAFYMYGSEAVKTNDEYSSLIYTLEESSKVAAQIAFSAGVKAGLSNKAMTARFKIEVKNMGKEIDNNFANISVLLYQYSDFCKEIMENPKEREGYWAKKSKAKYK
tara:strand:- start:1490 stop:1933 length:444 start_codon:yes stop_codon:yes gene_type:complete